MLLSAILVLFLILISHSPITSPNSPAPASCTYAISAAFDPRLTLKLHPPLPPPYKTSPQSSSPSCPKITSLAKPPRAPPLQSPVSNLQLLPVLPAHLPSRAFHHSAKPLYTQSSSCLTLS